MVMALSATLNTQGNTPVPEKSMKYGYLFFWIAVVVIAVVIALIAVLALAVGAAQRWIFEATATPQDSPSAERATIENVMPER